MRRQWITVLTPRPGLVEQQIAKELREGGFARLRFAIPPQYTVMALRDGEWTILTVDSLTGERR